VFGMPKAHENDPEMAIRAGLGILEAVQELGGELEKQWGIHDFQVRVGINTGLAALGGMTEAEDTVMGSTVNLTKRVESAAPPGGLLITHNTYRHVRGIFTVREHEPIQAKGFDGPVAVYTVMGVKPRAFRVQRRGVEGVETRMVGRKAELIALQEAYRNAIEGKQTQVVTVVGEAGVGKSRLLNEFGNWIELQPDEVRFFQGHCRQETQNLPSAMIKDVFSFRFQIQESDKAKEVEQKIEAGFGEVFGADDEGQMRAHIIGQLLGFDFSESQYVKGILDDPQQIHDRALMYLGEYFQVMSEQSPVVIFLEDIHWGDDSSLDMLNSLVRRIPEQHLLNVCVARHRLFERRPHWGEGLATHRRLELQPLTKHDSSQLVAEILQKVDQVPDSLQDLVVKGAEGNPFYIEELVKMLIEDGVILTGEAAWQVELHRLAEIDVPDTLTGVLQARLEGLPPEERNTLQQASVVGNIFWDNTIEYISTTTTPADTQSTIRTTDENLSSLRSRELIYHREESAFTDAAEYTFKHTLLRDVTYESVLKRVRRAYHGLVAEWLIQHSEARVGEYTGLIADHLELAGETDQAAIYYYQAGEAAEARFAHVEAVDYLSRALRLTQENDLNRRYDVLVAREEVLDSQGIRDAQYADLELLMEIAIALDDQRKQTQVALRQIIYHYRTGNFSAAIELVETTLNLAHTIGDIESEAEIYIYLSSSLWQLGRYEAALPPAEHALTLARANQLHNLEADSLRNLGTVFYFLLDDARSLSMKEQALEKYRQIGNRRGEAAGLNNIGVHYIARERNLAKAKNFYEQALAIFQEIGDRLGEGMVIGNLGGIAVDLDDYVAGIEQYSSSLDIMGKVGSKGGELSTCADLGACYFKLGEYDQAERYFNQALTIAREIGSVGGEINGLLYYVDFYLTLGNFARAQSYLRRILAKQDELESQEDKIWISLSLSRLNHLTGDDQVAHAHSNDALKILGDYKNSGLQSLGLIYLGHALTGLGKMAEAEEIFQKAVSLGYEMNKPRQAIEALAGLAGVSLILGDIEQAVTQVESILTYIEANTPPKGSSHPLDGMDDPFRVLLTCYQVLKSNDDPRANTILSDAYNLLQIRAANISDEHLRDCFLNNLAVNREIVGEYQMMGLED